MNVGTVTMRTRVSIGIRRWVLASAAVLLLLLVWSAPAHALAQRGHVFGGSFGTSFGEEGKEKLAGPTAVAVDEASSGEGAGDIYVLDRAANRVVVFGPKHEYLATWQSGGFESPVAIAVDDSKAEGDKSKGDVYIAVTPKLVEKFNPKGEVLDSKLHQANENGAGEVEGIAVDQNGEVWVDREGGPEGEPTEDYVLERFNDVTPHNEAIGVASELELSNAGAGEGTSPAKPGFAIEAEGEKSFDAYVTYESNGEDAEEMKEEVKEIAEREHERKARHEELKHEVPRETPQEPCGINACFVRKVALEEEPKEGILKEPNANEALIGALDDQSSTGVAVDLAGGGAQSGDVYLDNATSVAGLTSEGGLIQSFGSEQLHADAGGRGLAIDGATDEVLVADAPAARIDVYVPAPAGPPTITAHSVAVAKLTSNSAELRATVDPSGADTHYRFQYGTTSCATTSCSEAPAAPGTDIGGEFGDQAAAVAVSGLTPSTTYYLRAIAENSFAEEDIFSGEHPVISEEVTFTTPASVLTSALPDAREWELVSPPNKHGASIEPLLEHASLVQAAADGSAITYVTSGPVYENGSEVQGNRASERAQILSTREGAAWSTQDLVTANQVPAGLYSGGASEYQFFSTDLGEALVESLDYQLPLSAEASDFPIYLRHDLTCASEPSSCYEALVTPTNNTAGTTTPPGVKEAIQAATPDLHHVVFNSVEPLLAGETDGGLYEWSAERGLAPVSILPNGAQDEQAVSAGGDLSPTTGKAGTQMTATAISEDGSRVVWHSGHGAGLAGTDQALYTTDVLTGETLQVDEPNSNAPMSKVQPRPDFETANADGSKVFFTDTQRLTANSNASEAGQEEADTTDLYVFEADKPAGERVTDLTPDTDRTSRSAVGEPSDILGEALASEDGSLVYFVANGALAGEAEPGSCGAFFSPPGAECNLYVEHDGPEGWELPQLIARLSGEDNPDWGRPEPKNGYSLKLMTSRVSPDGEYLAFMSKMPLTGYDNDDANSNVPDEEVYLYDDGSGKLLCASCNPSGERPVGVHDVEDSGEGRGLLVDRPEVWIEYEGHVGIDHWLAGSIPGWTGISLLHANQQSRYLSNSGRLFFNSADALVPTDVNGKEDVYEYEPTGVGSCETANTEDGCVALISSGESEHESDFLDASENGNDVFFLTSSKLSPLDTDTAYDVYDARVCGVSGTEACASTPPTPPTACDSEACKAAATQQSTAASPASSALSGSGNILPQGEVLAAKTSAKPLTLAQKLAAALKSCRKLGQHSKRAACEKKARSSYLAAALKPCRKDTQKNKRAACESQARRKAGIQQSTAKKAGRR